MFGRKAKKITELEDLLEVRTQEVRNLVNSSQRLRLSNEQLTVEVKELKADLNEHAAREDEIAEAMQVAFLVALGEHTFNASFPDLQFSRLNWGKYYEKLKSADQQKGSAE